MKKILSIVLSVLFLVNALGITTFAGTYSQDGRTYTSTDPSDLPAENGDTVWEGPVAQYSCDEDVHTHSNSCYRLTCGGTSITHWWHSDSCYDKTDIICGKSEHQHSSYSCTTVYTWNAVDKSDAQWRNWWPVYWGYDNGSSVTDMSAVEAVIAGGQTVKFTSTGVATRDSLSDNTTDAGHTLQGVTITVQEGYYVSSYRFVCGNHTDCGVSSYNDRERIPNNDGNYTSSFTMYPSTDVYDHWMNIGEITTNRNGRNYIPWDKPTDGNLYHTSGSNIIYPFYILFEVQKDTRSYNLTYDWGVAALTAELPESVQNMARNASHTVQAPSTAALEEALSLGYAFAGWKVVGEGYNAEAMVGAGNTVTNYGSDITLVAQWTEKNTVIYSYTGTIPEGAPALPAIVEYHVGDVVEVASAPLLTGYTFVGWTTDDVTVNDGSFEMPDSPVRFTGEFVKDESQTKTLTYTVKYLFNEQSDAGYPDVVVTNEVWVNDPDTLPWNSSLIISRDDWEYVGSTPDVIPANIEDGSVIILHYQGTNPEIGVSKSVFYNGSPITGPVKVGDILSYTITVTNNGNADATDVEIIDTLNGAGVISFTATEGISYSQTTVPEYGTVDKFVIASLPHGESVQITYTYTVVAEDEGKTLTNFAYHSHDDHYSGDSETVEVTPQYTLTVEHYLDGVLADSKTAEYTMDEGSAWNIVISNTTDPSATHSKPIDIVGPGGVTYAFDDPATTDVLSGTLTGDLTVKLYYASDVTPFDGVPDKYQVKTVYETEVGGTIVGAEFEYGTIYRTSEFIDGDYAESGYVKVVGSRVQTSDGYEFKHWDLDRAGSPTLHLEYDEDLTDETIVYSNAHGGDVYTFTARFNTKKLEMMKNVSESSANVGDVLHYEIHVHNTGTVDLTNVTVNDILGYTDGTTFNGTISFTGVTGVTYDNGAFTIASLESGHFINIIYTYTVREADEGKTLTNTATVFFGGADNPTDTTTTDVLLRDRYTVTYTDGVDGEEVFADQVTGGLLEGDDTPAFVGTFTRDGYKFNGWSPDVSEKVDGDATYTAKWLAVNNVVYEYVGDVPENAPDAPDASEYTEGDTVTVEDAVTPPAGYLFSGWTTTEVTVENGKFEMPAVEVVFTGSFIRDDTQTKDISYTVEYYFNGEADPNVPPVPVKDTVWVNDPDTLSWDESLVGSFSGWKFDHSDPATIPSAIENGAVVKLYYVGTIVDLALTKDVADNSGAAVTAPVQVGDTLTYTVTVTNNGNTVAENIVVTDTMTGAGEINFTDTANVKFADGKFTLSSLGIGETVTIKYTYTVVAADGGNTLTNVAAVENNGDTIEAEEEVEVFNQYTLTVEYYFDGVLDDTMTETTSLNDGDTWSVVPEDSFTKNGVKYVFDEPATTDVLSGTAADVTVKLYYAADENGGGENGEEPDDIPDKYQIKVTFEVVNGAWDDGTRNSKITYVTLYDVNGNISPNGVGMLTADQIPAVGDKPNTGYYAGDWRVTPTTHYPIEEETTFVYEYKFVNPINPTIGKVTVIKVDADDMTKALSGVVFKLYRGTVSAGTYVGTYTTDEDGKFNIIQSAGVYYLVETRAHEGYTMNHEPIKVTVVSSMSGTLTVTNKKTEVPEAFTGDHYAYIIGRDDGLVHPEANITRAEVATIFFRMLSDGVREQYLTTENEYLDVKPGDWYNTAVSTLTAMGVLNGYNGMFRPDEFITRAEFAAIAARFDSNADTTGAAFSDIYGHWGQTEISQAANNGWVLGYEDGTFKPDQLITRAEAMTLVNRVLQRIPESPTDLIEGMIEWPDNADTGAWYYLAVQEATNSHDYVRKENGFESWIALLPNRDWTVFEK